MSRMDVMKELGTLALNHVEASFALELIRAGRSVEVALMTVLTYGLLEKRQLRDTLEKYMTGTVPPVVIQCRWTTQEFIELQNSMKGERNEGYEGTE
ncbi:MAG: hypothetical protein ACYDG4_10650 [Desulfuromonadaceae bacterium]